MEPHAVPSHLIRAPGRSWSSPIRERRTIAYQARPLPSLARSPLGNSPCILQEPSGFGFELLGRSLRPVRIAQHRARKKHQVGAALRQNILGLLWLRNDADGRRRNPRVPADAGSERDLVTRPDRYLLTRDDRAARAIDQVNS